MTAHDHHEFVPGCYRCDLSADEMGMGDPVDAMIERAITDPAYRDGMLAAAEIARAQGTDQTQPPCTASMAAVYIESVANGERP